TAADAEQVACLLDSNQCRELRDLRCGDDHCRFSPAAAPVRTVAGLRHRNHLRWSRMLSRPQQMLRSPMGPQMGGWQSILGRAVRERRQELELTLDEASRAIRISRSHLNLIELGKATGVSGEAVAGIDSGLGCQGALVALLPPKDAAGVTRGEEMRRAEFNKAVVALAASLLLDRERLIGSENFDGALLVAHESL